MFKVFESKIYLNILAVLIAVFLISTFVFSGSGVVVEDYYQQEKAQATNGNWDLSTTFGREQASMAKPISPFTVKKCGEVTHTDGDIMYVCLANFNGTSGGFYDSSKNLMVLGSFNENTLIHEIFHAASLHNYKKGYADMLSAVTQEKMAYDAENLLMQIRAFQDDMNITPDLSAAKKEALGLPKNIVSVKQSKQLSKK